MHCLTSHRMIGPILEAYRVVRRLPCKASDGILKIGVINVMVFDRVVGTRSGIGDERNSRSKTHHH